VDSRSRCAARPYRPPVLRLSPRLRALPLLLTAWAVAGCGGGGGGATGVVPPLVSAAATTSAATAASPSAAVTTSSVPATPLPTGSTAGSATPSAAATTTSTDTPSAAPNAVPAAAVEAAARAYYKAAAQVLRDNDLNGYRAVVTPDCACLQAFRQTVDRHRKQGQRLTGGEVVIIGVDIRSRSKGFANVVVTYSERPAQLLDRSGKVVGTDPGLTDSQDSLFLVAEGARLKVSTVLHLKAR